MGERKTVLTIIYINRQSKRKEIRYVLSPNMQNKSTCEFDFATFSFLFSEKTFSGWGYIIWGQEGAVPLVQKLLKISERPQQNSDQAQGHSRCGDCGAMYSGAKSSNFSMAFASGTEECLDPTSNPRDPYLGGS